MGFISEKNMYENHFHSLNKKYIELFYNKMKFEYEIDILEKYNLYHNTWKTIKRTKIIDLTNQDINSIYENSEYYSEDVKEIIFKIINDFISYTRIQKINKIKNGIGR